MQSPFTTYPNCIALILIYVHAPDPECVCVCVRASVCVCVCVCVQGQVVGVLLPSHAHSGTYLLNAATRL